MERYLVLLKSFKRMPTELEQTYRENVRCMTVRKHQIIQQPGVITDAIYFIEKGLFRLYYDRNGKTFTSGFRIEDDFIVAVEELNPDPQYADGIEALEDGILWCIPGSLIKDLNNDRSIQFQLQYTAIVTKECLLTRHAARCSVRDGGSENYQALCKYTPRLLQRVPVSYLAEFTGMPENIFHHLHSSNINLHLSMKRRRKR